MSLPPAPAVSVVIPAFNAGQWLADAVKSVLAQTWTDLECVIVDDGSTDGTADVIATLTDPRVASIRRTNSGTVADARNAGLAASRGMLVAFLDADDIWLPRKLEVVVGLLERRPHVGMAYSSYLITDSDLVEQTLIRCGNATTALRRWLLLEGNGIAFASTAIVRRSVLDEVGWFRSELSVSADVELAERIAAATAVVAAAEPLVLYRTHPNQSHRNLDVLERDRRWIFDDRQRSGRFETREITRGHANLDVRLFVYRMQLGQLTRASVHLWSALRMRPVRLVALPAEAMRRRVARRLARRRDPAGAELRRADIDALRMMLRDPPPSMSDAAF